MMDLNPLPLPTHDSACMLDDDMIAEEKSVYRVQGRNAVLQSKQCVTCLAVSTVGGVLLECKFTFIH